MSRCLGSLIAREKKTVKDLIYSSVCFPLFLLRQQRPTTQLYDASRIMRLAGAARRLGSDTVKMRVSKIPKKKHGWTDRRIHRLIEMLVSTKDMNTGYTSKRCHSPEVKKPYVSFLSFRVVRLFLFSSLICFSLSVSYMNVAFPMSVVSEFNECCIPHVCCPASECAHRSHL